MKEYREDEATKLPPRDTKESMISVCPSCGHQVEKIVDMESEEFLFKSTMCDECKIKSNQ